MRKNALVAACAASALVAAPALAAESAGVQVNAVSGTRTLSLLSLSGVGLTSADTIQTGPGQSGAFLTAVTDSNYGHVGYQVTSTLTDLKHATDPAVIPSSAVDVTVPANPLDLTGISRTVTPVFTLVGDLTGAVTDLLALPVGKSLTSVTTTVTGVPQAVAGDASHVLDGTLASLPIGVAKGAGGNFRDAAVLKADGSVDEAGATPVRLMSGSAQALTGTAILDRVKTTVGTSKTADMVTAGRLEAAAVMTAVANVLGVPVTLLDQTKVLAQLDASVTSLTGGILRQNGVYTSNQALQVAIPATAPSGAYRGILTVTLADVP